MKTQTQSAVALRHGDKVSAPDGEGPYYGLLHPPHAGPRVLYAQRLTVDHIRALQNGTALAVVIEKAYPLEAASHLAAQTLQDRRRSVYNGKSDLGRVGVSLFESGETPALSLEYWTQGQWGFEQNRRNAAPYPFPIDILRAWADENWEGGSGLLRLEGRTAYCGLCRVLGPSAAISPHADRIADDAPKSRDAREILHPIAANFHLVTAEVGGELELWDFRPTAEEVAVLGNGYGLRRDMLPPPAAIVRPRAGNLVLHAASAVHAVREVSGSRERVTASCFIGLEPQGSLRFWS